MMKRILSLAAILLLMFSLTVPAFAAGTITPREGDSYLYRGIRGDGPDVCGIGIAWGSKNFTIKRSDIKVTKGSAGAKLVGIEKNYIANQRTSEYLHNGSWEPGAYDHNEKNYSYTLRIQTQRTGSFKISYKLNGQTHTLNVSVLPFERHIKSISLTGVKNGSSFASLTKNQNVPSKPLYFSSLTKNAKLKITTSGQWRIRSVELVDLTDSLSAQRSSTGQNATMRSATIVWGTLDPTHQYRINVNLTNNNGFTSGYSYQINP